MLAKDVGGVAIGEGLGPTETRGNLREHPPIGARLAGGRQERPLARDAALRIGDGAILLTPGQGRQAHVGCTQRVV